jgi:hypothetical protein
MNFVGRICSLLLLLSGASGFPFIIKVKHIFKISFNKRTKIRDSRHIFFLQKGTCQRWASLPPEVTVKSLPLPTNLKIVTVNWFSLPA